MTSQTDSRLTPTLQATQPTVDHRTQMKGVTLIISQILPVLAIVSLFPAIPKLMHHFAGVAAADLLVPTIVTIPSLIVTLAAPLAGGLADRFGRRPVFIWGMVLYVVSGLAPILLNSLPLVIASRAILGIAEACVVTVANALFGDYFGEQRHRWVSWAGIVLPIAGIILIAMGGALADLSWRGPFLVYVLSVPTLVLGIIYIEEPERLAADASGCARLPYPWKQSVLIAGVTIVTSLIYYVEPLNIARVLAGMGAQSATLDGLIQASTCAGYVLGAFLFQRLHRLNIGYLLSLAAAAVGVGMLLIGSQRTIGGVALGAVIQQFGSGLVIPALLAWAPSILPLEQRGRGMGVWTGAFSSGAFLCPPIIALILRSAQNLQGVITGAGVVSLILAGAAGLAGLALASRSPTLSKL